MGKSSALSLQGISVEEYKKLFKEVSKMLLHNFVGIEFNLGASKQNSQTSTCSAEIRILHAPVHTPSCIARRVTSELNFKWDRSLPQSAQSMYA